MSQEDLSNSRASIYIRQKYIAIVDINPDHPIPQDNNQIVESSSLVVEQSEYSEAQDNENEENEENEDQQSNSVQEWNSENQSRNRRPQKMKMMKSETSQLIGFVAKGSQHKSKIVSLPEVSQDMKEFTQKAIRSKKQVVGRIGGLEGQRKMIEKQYFENLDEQKRQNDKINQLNEVYPTFSLLFTYFLFLQLKLSLYFINKHFYYHFSSTRNLDTPKYFQSAYFFFNAFSFELGRVMFCKARHISLKHLSMASLSTFQPSSTLVSDFIFKIVSATISALRTIVFMQYYFPSPSYNDNSMTYLAMAKVRCESLVSLPLASQAHLSLMASRMARGVVWLRLKSRASRILPSIVLSSEAEQLLSVTWTQFCMRGGQISSYLLAIHRQAVPTSWQSCLVMSTSEEQWLRQAKASCRVCSLRSNDECTSMSQSIRI